MTLGRVVATRFLGAVTASSSRPLKVEADDGRAWLLKLRSSGHGVKALVAEILASGIARAIGLEVPELAIVHFDGAVADAVPGDEMREASDASRGDVLGVAWLAGAWVLRPEDVASVAPEVASKIAWLDAFVDNMDRTARNPNILVWKGRAWPVDHGIAFPFHFGGEDPIVAAAAPLALRPDHIFTGALGRFDGRDALTPEAIETIVDAVPSAWAPDLDVYRRYLSARALRRD